MIINVGDSGGGIIVQPDEPVGDESMLWVDTAHNSITKYWDKDANGGEGAWLPTATVWA